MLHREIIAVCSEIHTIHINTIRGQNVEFLLMSKLEAHIVTTELQKEDLHVQICSCKSSRKCHI